jgi:hypothetical protein
MIRNQMAMSYSKVFSLGKRQGEPLEYHLIIGDPRVLYG